MNYSDFATDFVVGFTSFDAFDIIMSIVLRLRNIHSHVLTEDTKLRRGLQHHFSYVHPKFYALKKKVEGGTVQVNKLPHYRWAGFVNVFDSKSGRFPTGLIADVKTFLISNNVDWEEQDERGFKGTYPEPDVVTPDILSTKENPLTLRDYQVQVANLALQERRGIIKCATGGGKTLMFTAILKALKNQYQTVVLTRSISLLDQTFEVFEKAGIQNIGRVGGKHFNPTLITCSTIQSLHKLSKELIKNTQVLIVDEVHQFASKESAKWMKMFKNASIRLGFSATPWKADDPLHNWQVKSWLGPELCDISTFELKSVKVLSESTAHFYKIDCSIIPKYLPWIEAEEFGIVQNEPFHEKVAAIVNAVPEGRILVLVKRIAHGDALQALIPDAYWVKGEDSAETRDYVFSQLRETDKKKVVAIISPIGFLGINVYVHHLVNACGGKEASLLIQKVGRGLRRASDKDELHYHDFIFEHNPYLEEHSLYRIETLKSEGHPV
eukprot:CAMPEP_0168530062 /NCGR_PEP_ID=MMETSP0405-20121227/14384_1 /TAXON_ID=498012 /ORGANISM="Trichosphaerium sp, Strain Am-I-7 wt" /LENGTH=494 /DNA_ID=CAMNT_0008554113 /DNA_START=719 /DNA_END=2199 /DNA_ORIENTATION=+